MKPFKTIAVAFILFAFIGCEELIELPDISAENVQLVAPTTGVTLTQANIQFNWAEVEEATYYHLQIATPNFENARQLVSDQLLFVDSTYTGTHVIETLENGEYQWRVRAINSAYETDFSTSTFNVDLSN